MSQPEATTKRRRIRGPALVGVLSLIIGFLALGKALGDAGGDITILMAFGEDATTITAHAEEVLDREVYLRGAQGHDGKYFFLQALDPLYLNPEEHARFLDRPTYRGQRMLYPLLAGLGGIVPDPLVPWTMVLVNLLALAAGGWATARLAQRFGGNPLWGLAFPLNVGLLSELAISGAGIIAFAAAIMAFDALEAEEFRRGAVWLTVSVLAREAMLLAALGTFLLARRRTGRWQWKLLAWPAVAAGAWAGYLRLRLDAGSGVDEVQELGIPFGGIVDAFPRWLDQPFDLLVALTLFALLATFTVRTIRDPSYLGWGSAGFVVLAILFTRQVWLRYFDISRAIAPVITAFVVVTFAGHRVQDD